MTIGAANQMIQELCRSTDGIKKLTSDLEAAFAEFDLSEDEKSALRDQAPFQMTKAGIHPLLCMHYLFALNRRMSAMMSIQ